MTGQPSLNLVVTLVLLSSVHGLQKIVDLTHTLKEDSVKFPIYIPMKIDTFFADPIVGSDGVTYTAQANLITTVEHYGTHLDAPTHFENTSAPGYQWTTTDIPMERLFHVPARVIDFTEEAAENPDFMVEAKHILEHERQYGKIPAGTVVLLNFGWATKYEQGEEAYFGTDSEGTMHFPGVMASAAQLFVDRGIYGVGTDTISTDHGEAHKDLSKLSAHLTLLPNNIFILENIADMSELPAKGATLVIGVMKIYGGTGGPARVVASFDTVFGPWRRNGFRFTFRNKDVN